MEPRPLGPPEGAEGAFLELPDGAAPLGGEPSRILRGEGGKPCGTNPFCSSASTARCFFRRPLNRLQKACAHPRAPARPPQTIRNLST